MKLAYCDLFVTCILRLIGYSGVAASQFSSGHASSASSGPCGPSFAHSRSSRACSLRGGSGSVEGARDGSCSRVTRTRFPSRRGTGSSNAIVFPRTNPATAVGMRRVCARVRAGAPGQPPLLWSLGQSRTTSDSELSLANERKRGRRGSSLAAAPRREGAGRNRGVREAADAHAAEPFREARVSAWGFRGALRT